MKNIKKNNSYFLVTTALEESWKEKEQTIFLGEWCLIYNKDKYPNHIVNSYHWDDRDKYNRDFYFIDNLYEKKLKEFSILLNKKHNVNQNTEYWRIIIGSWLRSFIEVFFDRYEIIKSIKNEISDTIILDYEKKNFIPLNYNEFYSQIKSDEWNHMIFSEIIRSMNIPYSLSNNKLKQRIKTQKYFTKKIKLISKNFFLKIYTIFITKSLNKVIIQNPYMPLINELKLNLNLFQLPIRHPDYTIKKPKASFNRISSQKSISKNKFENLLDTLLIDMIPYSYLENFRKIKTLNELFYNKNPELIFTSNAYQHDDYFKIMTAEKKSKGTKYIIGQHGGNFKIGKLNQTILHQLKSSSIFVSWGWEKYKSDLYNIRKMPSLKLSKKISKPDPKGYILITAPSYPRYFYCHFSVPVAGQFLKVIESIFCFIKKLDTTNSHLLKIKLDSDEFGWNITERFRYNGFSKMLTKNQNLYILLSKSRISISTYNSTIYYETLSANFPTVIFFDTKYYEISDSSIEIFNLLKSVGIFHESPTLAAKFVNSILENINDWWLKEEVQEARVEFCNKFALKSKTYLKEWKYFLKNV